MISFFERKKLHLKTVFLINVGLLRLTVNNCTQADVGKYTCRIYNTHGEDVCNAELVYDSMYSQKRPIRKFYFKHFFYRSRL